MGYAGYVPAKLPPSALSPAEAALQQIASMEALEVLGKLHYNLAVLPKEDKYRRIKLSNKKIQETIVDTAGVMDAMLALGWVKSEAGDELVVPEKLYFKMDVVRQVDTAKQLLKKKQEEQFKREMRQKSASASTPAASLAPALQA